jgi:tyrosine-protein kinase Etk/Wzc
MKQLHTTINNQEDSDLVRIIGLFTRHFRIYLLCICIALVLAFLFNRYAIPVYRIASSLMILENNKPQAGNADEYINNELFGLNQGFQNELYVIQSTPVVEQTIKNLDLTVSYYEKNGFRYFDAYKSAPFRVLVLQDHVQPVNIRFMVSIQDDINYTIKAEGDPAVFTNLYTGGNTFQKKKWIFEKSGKFGELLETPEMAFIIKRDSSFGSYVKNEYIYGYEFSTVASMTGHIKGQLDFSVINREATVIEITLRNSSSLKGVDILNELMDVYSTQNVNHKNHIANVTIEYIERQLGEISDSLSQTEDNLQRFRSSRQLLDVTGQASNMSEQYMTLQNQLAEITTRKRYYDYLADYISSNQDFSNMIVPSAMGVDDELLNNLVSELIAAQTQRSNLIRNRQEKNPLVQRLEIQIDNTKKTISENIAAVRKTTDISIDEMNKRINKIKSDISRLPQTQRQLGGIERTYRLNDAIYNYLLEKRAEAKISQASNMPDNVIVEPATTVGIISPDPRKNYIFAFAIGIILPFSLLFFRNMMNDKIDYQEKVDHLADAPILGKIPHGRKKASNNAFENPQSAMAEAYRALRTNIEYRFKDILPKVILVSSSIEGEGKSYNALNIAMSYAQLGRKTLLIDFDLRKPTGYFAGNEISSVGLSSYFTLKVELSEIIQHSPHPKLDYIPSGPIPPNPVEMLASDDIRDMLDRVKEQYYYIIIDSAPLAQVADAYLLLDYANIRIIVARYNYTLKRIFHLVMDDLKNKNINNLCVVMNDNKVFREQYGYGYGYAKKKSIWSKFKTRIS